MGGGGLPGSEDLRRNDFDHSNHFQSSKQLAVNTKNQLKSRFRMPFRTTILKLKKKW